MADVLFFVIALTLSGGALKMEQYPVQSYEQCMLGVEVIREIKAKEYAVITCVGFPDPEQEGDPA